VKFPLQVIISRRCLNIEWIEKYVLIGKHMLINLLVPFVMQGENIRFNPEMYGACDGDAKRYCSDVTEGQAKVDCMKTYLKFKKNIFSILLLHQYFM